LKQVFNSLQIFTSVFLLKVLLKYGFCQSPQTLHTGDSQMVYDAVTHQLLCLSTAGEGESIGSQTPEL